jgi:hypothetical protein
MLIVIDRNNYLYLFNNINEAYSYLEVCEFEYDEYEMCDEEGLKHIGEVTKKSTFFRSGSYELKSVGKPDISYALSIVNRAEFFDKGRTSINDLDELRELILSK